MGLEPVVGALPAANARRGRRRDTAYRERRRGVRWTPAAYRARRRHRIVGALPAAPASPDLVSLRIPKPRDLLNLFWRESAWNLATRQLLALDVMAHTFDDLRVRKCRRISNIGEVAARSQNPAHDFA